MAHAWLEAQGLSAAYQRVFDEEDFPRDIPSSSTHLLSTVLPPAALDKVLLAAASDHVPLSSVLSHMYRGQPRNRFTQHEIATGFEVFVAPRAAAPAPAVPKAEPSASAGAIGGGIAASTHAGVAGSAGAVADTHTQAGGVHGVEGEVEDPRIELMGLTPDIYLELSREVLRPFWQPVFSRKWEDWPIGAGNPFIPKITRGNAAKLGVPRYFDYIANPMDLTRIREKIDAGKYRNAQELLDDLALMLANAKTYNRPPSAASIPGFPDPSFFPKHEMHGSVYRMAFELERDIAAQAPALLARWAAAERREKKRVFEATLASLTGQY